MINKKIEDLYKELDIIIKKYGLEKAWFSDSLHYIALGENTSFYVKKKNGVIGFVTSENQKVVVELTNIITDLTGTVIER